MSARGNIKVAAAILAATAVLVATVVWNDPPGSYMDCANEIPAPVGPDELVQPYAIVDCYREVSTVERAAKLFVALLALSGVSLVASSVAATAKGWASAAACASSAVLALFSLSFAYAQSRGGWELPHPIAVLVFGAAGAIIGAAFGWAFARWRPNIALERTREG